MLVVDTLSTRSGRTLEETGQTLPLNLAERSAYEEVDSTKTLEEAFKPTGFLANMVGSDDDEQRNRSGFARISSVFEPVVWYNRVDALHAGMHITSPSWKGLRARGSLGYSTGTGDWGYGGELRYNVRFSRGSWFNRTRFETGYRNNTLNIGTPSMYNMPVAGVLPLLGVQDYYDYYRNEQAWFSIGQTFRPLRSSLELRINHESHSSLDKNTNYSILGGNLQPENPEIVSGILRTGEIRLTLGGSQVPMGLAGQNGIQLAVEHSDPGLLGGDFNFTTYRASADIRIATFYRRRFLPNELDLHLMAGTYSGNLPVQRFSTVDGSMGLFRPFGTLRTLTNRPLMAPNYAFAFWEHNFRTVPFEMLGLYGVARRGIGIVVHGASGHTWQNGQSDLLRYAGKEGFHHEVGLSVNGIFSILRLDATMRLDQPGFTAGIGLARFF